MTFTPFTDKDSDDYDNRIEGHLYMSSNGFLIKDFRNYSSSDVERYDIIHGAVYAVKGKDAEVFYVTPSVSGSITPLYYHLYARDVLLEGIQLESDEPLPLPYDSVITEFITNPNIN